MKTKLKRSTFRHISQMITCILILSMLLSYLPISSFAEPTVYHSVKTNSKQIAITFDDGPHPYLTDRIMEILDRYHAKATFFMVGINVINYPEVAKKVIQNGHEIGNHTFSHSHLKALNEASLQRELGACEDALEELFEYRPHLFRPPEGAINQYIQHCSETSDYELILWSIDTRDWEKKNAVEIAQEVLSRVKPGDIILMHDYIGRRSQTPEALEILLPRLIELGYEPVTVSRLLGIA